MIRRSGATLVLWALCGLLASAFPVTVLYTSDIHVRLDRLESIALEVQQERDEGVPVLLFDAGDAWQDHRQWLSNVWGAERMIAWMNATGYDAMTIGNHDTYWGRLRLTQLIERATFPVLSANWQPVNRDQKPWRSTTLLEVEGSSILVVGLTTPEFLPIPAYSDWHYRDPVAALHEQLEKHAGTFDWVFVVGHIGLEEARLIARDVPQIDLFISGHSHEATEQPLVAGNARIVQSGAFGQNLGRLKLDLDVSTHELLVLEQSLVPIERTPVDVRAGVQHLASVLAVIACAIVVWML